MMYPQRWWANPLGIPKEAARGRQYYCKPFELSLAMRHHTGRWWPEARAQMGRRGIYALR